ncbi:MAG TPA: radical SAM protein [Nitrososphaeria archaeon]|nr:radical SAM protein [Nitrososphaeria archaeon]
MMDLRRVVVVDEDRCVGCGFCKDVSVCKSVGECIGCLACYYACPYEARVIKVEKVERKLVKILVDGVEYEVPSRISVKEALELIGIAFKPPGSKGLAAPCGLGGCWACAVLIDGELERTCITPIKDGMRIELDVEEVEPLRIVHGPQPHRVGGKATPWWEVDGYGYVEAAIWTAGCNLRCPQCQNYHVTYDNSSKPMTPLEAARALTECRLVYGVRGLAVSGGEPTLNRRWLIELFRHLREMNPDARLHLDSNGTILSRDYVDELVEAGCDNIGIEPKAARLETYMKITGMADEEKAKRFLENSWEILEYVASSYSDEVYLGAGFAYNSAWMSLEEVAEIGDRIASIDPSLQVTVLDYFPTFRRRWIKRPTPREMLRVKKILEERGLRTVIVQTSAGHIGPGDRTARY